MTQVWPDFGDAPVPTLLSMICKPEAVVTEAEVMGFPAVWADAVAAMRDELTAAAMAASAVWMIVRREDRIMNTFRKRRTSLAQGGLFP
jgi:hypothetical protein